MGDDTPPAVLSDRYRPLSHYFRQNFSQVTNPPIDSLREHRVMSLKTRFGNLKNVLDEDNSQTEILQLESPFVSNARFEAMVAAVRRRGGGDRLHLRAGAGRAAGRARADPRRGRGGGARRGEPHHPVRHGPGRRARAAMPMILATSAVHSWLTRKGLRTFTSLNVRSAECIDPHYFAVLIGSGATTVNAYLAQDSIADRIARGLIEGSLTEAVARYPRGDRPGAAEDHLEDGDRGDLLLSRRAELRGGGAVAGDGGRVLPGHAQPDLRHRHHRGAAAGRGDPCARLARRRRGAADRRVLQGRRSGESHAWEARAMHILQSACDRGSYDVWKQYSKAMQARPPIHLRDLLDFQPKAGPAPIDEVESITAIRKRFVTPGMSPRGAEPGGAQDAERGDEPDRREVGLGRGRRGSGALRAGAERRQPERQDQAGGERAVRGDGRLPEPLRRARDQDRARARSPARAGSCRGSR